MGKPLLYLDRWIFEWNPSGYRYYLDINRSCPCHHGVYETLADCKKAIEKSRAKAVNK